MIGAATDVEAALEHCRDLTRRRARNFYYGLKLLPEGKRAALYALYAWMRRADDIADDPLPGGEEAVARLEAFRRRTDEILGGAAPGDDPLWVALAHTVARHALPAEHFHHLLDGQLDDLRHRRYASWDELRQYCHRVASTVGLLCIEVWGYEDPRAPGLAVDRGIAFQLTNIVRDFVEDYDEGRVYLPAEEFGHAGIEPADLRAWRKPDRCAAFLQTQLQRGREHYERSAPLDDMISADCRPTLWAMTSIYRGLLEKMADDPSRVVQGRRVRLSSLAKAGIAVRAKWLFNGSVRQ